MNLPEKSNLRKHYRQILKELPPLQKDEQSHNLNHLLQNHPQWQTARSVLFYSPRPDEPNLLPSLQASLLTHTHTALPAFNPETQTYVARSIKHWPNDGVLGPFQIWEPLPIQPILPWDIFDLILVPGLAFNLHGNRLGRGKGYYDRILIQTRGFTLGIAFSQQIHPSPLPQEPHDILLQEILQACSEP